MSNRTTRIDEIAELMVHIGRSARGEDAGAELTAAQWTGLRFFARANSASRTPSAFASFQATTRGTASQTIKSLESKGLLARRQSEHDGRSVVFAITEAGRAMLCNDPLRHLMAALERLPPEACETLSRSLSQVAADLATLRGCRAFGTCEGCSHYAADGGSKGGYCACVAADLAPDEIGRLCANFDQRHDTLPVPPLKTERS